MSQDFDFKRDNESDRKIYFLTDRRFYELLYRRVLTYDESGRVLPEDQWEIHYTSPLQEYRLRGGDVMRIVMDAIRSRAVVISLMPTEEASDDGSARIEVSEGELPASLVFILPSQATPKAQEGEIDQQDRSSSNDLEEKIQFSPHAVSLERERSGQFYDVIEVSSNVGDVNSFATHVSYKQALAQSRYLEQSEDALIFRYHDESALPPGKRRDSLEWLNPQYEPWQEPLGFFFRGLYFETTTVVEVAGEQGPEKVPTEVYLATAFQVDREGQREASIYRPFGRREDAVNWLDSVMHVKASITKLVPDPGSTNWFVLSDLQNLNPLGFRSQGEVEWLR